MLVLVIAIGAVAVAYVRTRLENVPESPATGDAVPTEARSVTTTLPPLPAWCVPVLQLAEDASLTAISTAYAAAAAVAPESVATDLQAVVDMLNGTYVEPTLPPTTIGEALATSTSSTATTGASSTSVGDMGSTVDVEADTIDAEGRVPEDDPRLRTAARIESDCRRVATEQVPYDTEPDVVVESTP